METEDLALQLGTFERFLERNLLRDRKKYSTLSVTLRGRISQYEVVISQLDKVNNKLKEEGKGCKVMLEVVAGVKREATISKTDKYIINVGGEVFVEFSLLEALRFCYQKIYYLQQMLDTTTAKQVEIETLIGKVTETLEELKKITDQ